MISHRHRVLARAIPVLATLLACSDGATDVQGCPITDEWGPWYSGSEPSYEYYPAINGQTH